MCQIIVFYINFTSIEKMWHLFLIWVLSFFLQWTRSYFRHLIQCDKMGVGCITIFMLWTIWGLYFINNLDLQLKDIYPFLPLSTTNNWKSNLFPCLWSWFFFGNRSRINNAELFLPVKVIKICKSQIITDKETLDK